MRPSLLRLQVALLLFFVTLDTTTAWMEVAPQGGRDFSVESAAWRLPKEPFTLRNAPGLELVRLNCLLCHSTEYISTQPPLSASQWQAEVTKMKVKFGASILTNSIPDLVDYLVVNYGRVGP